MGRSIGVLTVGKVIGDVIDPFAPAAEIIVLYGSKQVSNGCDIKPSLAAERPHVMVDPDAPSPSEPTYREWLHW
ncbi:PEBP-like superfamily [Sesbania bispinosa]|nr:PEBP-like superfamily [Sesbania bispinosa]